MPAASSDSVVTWLCWPHLYSSCDACICVMVVWTSCLPGKGESLVWRKDASWSAAIVRRQHPRTASYHARPPSPRIRESSSEHLVLRVWVSFTVTESEHEVGLLLASAKTSEPRTTGDKYLYFLKNGADHQCWIHYTAADPESKPALPDLAHLTPPAWIYEKTKEGQREGRPSFFEENCHRGDLSWVSFWPPQGNRRGLLSFSYLIQEMGASGNHLYRGQRREITISSHPCPGLQEFLDPVIALGHEITGGTVIGRMWSVVPAVFGA